MGCGPASSGAWIPNYHSGFWNRFTWTTQSVCTSHVHTFVTWIKEMDELPDDLVYPTPPLNKEQLLDIEAIFKDLIHGGSAFESAQPNTKDLADAFKSQNTPSGIDSGM